jgi:hypothetical protein
MLKDWQIEPKMDVHNKMSKWHSSSSSSFLDGTKMRLIPPINNILSREGKMKMATLLMHQEALNSCLAFTTSWEFATNLLLDKISPNSNISLPQVIMRIQSSAFPNCGVFHTIDKSWRKENGVTFTFVLENESDGRMYVAGLITYLRAFDPWFLSQFTEEARNWHRSSHWDEKLKQVFSTDKLEMADNIYLDDELKCSDEPTLSRYQVPSSNIVVVIPDADSVSTFRSRRQLPLSTP